MTKRKSGLALILAGALLLLSAGALLFRNYREDQLAAEEASLAAQKLRQYMAEAPEERPVPAAGSDPAKSESRAASLAYRNPEDEEFLPAAEKPLKEEREADTSSVIRIDGFDYIGILDVPDLALSLPVMADWDYARLKIAPCRYSGNAKNGDLVLAAHNYATHFGHIPSLDIGSELVFTDVNENSSKYRITAVRKIEAGDFASVLDNDAPLTLFTCTWGGKARLAVYCEKS